MKGFQTYLSSEIETTPDFFETNICTYQSGSLNSIADSNT